MSRPALPNERIDLGELLEALQALGRGDFSPRMCVHAPDCVEADIARSLNATMTMLGELTASMLRVCQAAGTDGNLCRAVPNLPVEGQWKRVADGVSAMSINLGQQVRNLGSVLNALHEDDYSRRMTVDCLGEMRELRDYFNALVDRWERERAAGVM